MRPPAARRPARADAAAAGLGAGTGHRLQTDLPEDGREAEPVIERPAAGLIFSAPTRREGEGHVIGQNIIQSERAAGEDRRGEVAVDQEFVGAERDSGDHHQERHGAAGGLQHRGGLQPGQAGGGDQAGRGVQRAGELPVLDLAHDGHCGVHLHRNGFDDETFL